MRQTNMVQLVVIALLAICELRVTAKPVDGDDRVTMRKLMDMDGAASYFYRVSHSSGGGDTLTQQTNPTGGQQRPTPNLLFNFGRSEWEILQPASSDSAQHPEASDLQQTSATHLSSATFTAIHLLGTLRGRLPNQLLPATAAEGRFVRAVSAIRS